MITTLKTGLAAVVLAGLAGSVTAAPFTVPITLPGPTQFDGFEQLNGSNQEVLVWNIQNPTNTFPTFGTAGNPWPTSFSSNLPGSGDATFIKTDGFGYPAGFGIYASPAFFPGDLKEGTFTVTDPQPLIDAETAVFQVVGTPGSSGLLKNDPTLTVNGTDVLNPIDSQVADSGLTIDLGGFGGVTAVPSLVFQFDLRGITDPITDLVATFETAGSSTSITALQLDQGGFLPLAAAVPEPGSLALLGLGGFAAIARRRR